MYKLILIALAFTLIQGCSSTKNYGQLEQKNVTEKVSAEYALYSMMASNSYHNSSRIHFPLELIGWHQISPDGEKTSQPSVSHWFTGLAYDIYKNENTGQVVVAFRGSDSKWDYVMSNFAVPISPAYKQAFKEFQSLQKKYNNIMVTGHSLGGGIALGISVRFAVPAVAFDSSPRVFDGLGDNHKTSNRVLIYQSDEVLEKIRKKWFKIAEVLQESNIYKTTCDFGNKSNHRADLLAKCLLDNGKDINSDLKIISDNIKKP